MCGNLRVVKSSKNRYNLFIITSNNKTPKTSENTNFESIILFNIS